MRQDKTASRKAAYFLGLDAESLAATTLRLKGYAILAQRYRAGGGEIDIIARKGVFVAFVEVKARADEDVALMALDSRKIGSIGMAARAFLADPRCPAGAVYRLDLMIVTGARWPKHLRNIADMPFVF